MWIEPFAALLMLLAAPIDADVKPIAWQQVESKLTFHVFPERERYTTLDRRVRVVMSVDHKGADLDALSVAWSLTGPATAQGQTKIAQGAVDLTLPRAALPAGDYTFSATLSQGDEKLAEQSAPLRVAQVAAPAQSGRVRLHLPRGQPAKQWPVQAGVPFPKGALWDADQVKVIDPQGREVDAGVVVRSRWGNDPAASIRWLGVDFQPARAKSDWPQPVGEGYTVVFGDDVKRAAPRAKLDVKATADAIDIDTGAAQLTIDRKRFNVIDRFAAGGVSYEAQPQHGLYVTDHEGTTYRAANDKAVDVTIEERTATRVVIRAAGWYVKDGAANPQHHDFRLPTDRLCRFITRIEAYAGRSQVRVMNTLIITFDTFNVRLTDAAMALPIPGNSATKATFGIEDDDPQTKFVGPAGVRGVQHLHDAFAIEDGDGKTLTDARRSAGWAIARNSDAAIALTLRDLWQRYPKEIEVRPDALTLHVWPKHGRTHDDINGIAPANIHKLMYAHEGNELVFNAPWEYFIAGCVQYDNDSFGVYKPTGHPAAAVHASGMGVASTSDVMIELGRAGDVDALAANSETFMLAPHAVADPKWTCDSKAVGLITAYDPQAFPAIEQTTADLMRGYWGMQEWGEMYGMWIYRSWLHANYKEDKGGWSIYRLYNGAHHHEPPIPWILYARSGDPFYLTQGMSNIRQLTDVQMIHHDEPGYMHKEFHSHQMRLVGSTKHDDSISPWGNDHGILGHLCAYNGAMLAYYMTGDLRLREVVVDEWQNTLLTERDNPEYAKADRSNTAYPQNPRDNSTAVGEIIDLYQLTYDPRLLALLAPRMDIWLNAPGCMGTDWGQPMHNVMLFHGSKQAERQLVAGAHALVNEMPHLEKINQTIARPLHAARELLALASLVEPDAGFAAHAFSFDNMGYIRGYAWNRIHRKRYDMHCPAGEYTLFMPRLMYALSQQDDAGLAQVLGAGMTAPRLPGSHTRVIVREETDRPFDIYVNGKVTQEGGFDVKVYSPAGALAAQGHVDPGYQAYKLTVPSDGRNGDYVIIMGAIQKDNVTAPYTDLPEVYITTYTTGNNDMQFLYTRAAGDAPETFTLSPHQGPASALAADGKTVLAETENGEVLTVNVGKEGIWAVNRSCYLGITRGDKQPAILSVTPDRWFNPTDDALNFQPPE